MANKINLTQEQLKDPTVLEKIRQLAEPIIWHMLTKEAYNLAFNLERSVESANLKSIEPKLTQEYENIVIQLKLTALPMLSDEQVIKIIGQHFLDGLGANIEMKNRLTAKLFALPLIPRDEFRQQLQKALQNNRQKIGPWSIQNWLADYNNFADPGERTNISPREYLLQSRQAGPLSKEDKNKLYMLFHIYDHLLLVTPVVSEEELSEIVGRAGRPPLPERVAPRPRPVPPLTPEPPFAQPSPSLPTQPPAPEPTRAIPSRRDIYREPIEEPPKPGQVEPRIEGNIVDLKRQS